MRAGYHPRVVRAEEMMEKLFSPASDRLEARIGLIVHVPDKHAHYCLDVSIVSAISV